MPEDQEIPKQITTEFDSGTSLTDTAISQLLTQPTNMEVHHHPKVEKKNFKEYVLEFIMIFLAVTMGFFAESLREHITDKKNEKQIILALKKDLVKDTVVLHNLIDNYIPTYHSWVDSSHYEIDSLPLKGNEKRISKTLFNTTFWKIYTPPTIALTILKNPSTFNLIENETVKKEILDYNVSIDHFIKYSEFLIGLQHSIDTSFAALVNRQTSRIFLDGLGIHNNFLNDGDVPENVVFKNYDKMVLRNFVNRLDQIDFKIHDIGGFYQDILKQDINLLRLFNEQYQL